MAFKLLFLCVVALFTFASAQFPYQTRKYAPVTPKPYQYQYTNRDTNDGRYYHDDSGAYNPDGSGAYVHDDNPYKHQAGGSGGSGPGYTGYRDRYYSSPTPAAVAAPLPAGLKTGSAAGLYDNRNYAIIRKVEDVGLDGYHYLYETENGILGEEEGHLEQKGGDKEAMKAKGFFKYTGPDNIIYEVQYTADEEGFKPVGAHLPQPPAIPEYIVRSLAYQRSIGVLKD